MCQFFIHHAVAWNKQKTRLHHILKHERLYSTLSIKYETKTDDGRSYFSSTQKRNGGKSIFNKFVCLYHGIELATWPIYKYSILAANIRRIPVWIHSESLESYNTKELREEKHCNNRALVVFFENNWMDLHGTKTLTIMNAINAIANVEEFISITVVREYRSRGIEYLAIGKLRK